MRDTGKLDDHRCGAAGRHGGRVDSQAYVNVLVQARAALWIHESAAALYVRALPVDQWQGEPTSSRPGTLGAGTFIVTSSAIESINHPTGEVLLFARELPQPALGSPQAVWQRACYGSADHVTRSIPRCMLMTTIDQPEPQAPIPRLASPASCAARAQPSNGRTSGCFPNWSASLYNTPAVRRGFCLPGS